MLSHLGLIFIFLHFIPMVMVIKGSFALSTRLMMAHDYNGEYSRGINANLTKLKRPNPLNDTWNKLSITYTNDKNMKYYRFKVKIQIQF